MIKMRLSLPYFGVRNTERGYFRHSGTPAAIASRVIQYAAPIIGLVAIACGAGAPVPSVKVECKPCTPNEVGRYELRLNHELNYLAQLLKFGLDSPIVFKSGDARHFVYDGKRNTLRLHRGDILDDNHREVRKALALAMLPSTLVPWYDAAVRDLAANTEDYVYRIDGRLLGIYDETLRTGKVRQISTEDKGEKFLRVLIRANGLDVRNYGVPKEVHDRLRDPNPGSVAEEEIINMHEKELGVSLSNWRLASAYLKHSGLDP